MLIDLREAPLADRGLMNALVAPRPIAWIATRDRRGVGNLAPFSHFNVASSAPPVLMVSINSPEDRPQKDTLANILETGAFSVNLVGRDQLREMVASSEALAPGEDEATALGIDMTECEWIDCPRVVASPAHFECRLFRTVKIEPEMHGDTLSTLLLGRVIGIRLDPSYLDSRGRFDPALAGLAARAAGISYLTIKETIEMPAPFRRAGTGTL